MELSQVAPGLHRIVCPFGERVVAVHLLLGDDAAVLVDAGDFDHPQTAIEPALARLGLGFGDLTHLVVTHADADHVGGLAAIAERAPRAVVVAHALEVAAIEDAATLVAARYRSAPEARRAEVRERYRPVRVDRVVGGRGAAADGAAAGGSASETLALGGGRAVELVHLPGHSPGHLGLFDGTRRIALIGDALLADGIPGRDGTVAMPPPIEDAGAYLASAERVRAFDPELLLTGHFPVLRGVSACRAFVAASVRTAKRA